MLQSTLWINKNSWYRIDFGVDLFDSVLIRSWGRLGSGMSGRKLVTIAPADKLVRIKLKTETRCKRLGYKKTPS